MSESIDVHRPDTAPAPGPEARGPGGLVGRWRPVGQFVGDVPVPITGTDVHEWPLVACSSSITSPCARR